LRKKIKRFMSATRRDVPIIVDKRFRYRHPPLPQDGTSYRITIPAGKDRPD
jgi:hypothetical protein